MSDDILDVEENKEAPKKEASDYKPGVGVDVGTSNIVVARQKADGTFVNRFHRDMLYPLDASEEAIDFLERSDYLYVKVDNKYYIVGEDALKIVNAIGKGQVVRPMQDGILNPNLKESSELLFYIIKAVVGDPLIENEPLRFSVPANPVDKDLDNRFHEMILKSFFAQMGYDASPVNEAMCVAYDCAPVTKDDDEEIPLTGVGISCGGGMTNVALCLKGLPLNTFSVTKSGDYIDEQASKVTGIAASKVIKQKEKKLDLGSFDMSDRTLAALRIYYEETINRIIHHMTKEFKSKDAEVDGEIEIVIAGGTSMPKGYCDMFKQCLDKSEFPFDVWNVRHSQTPFYSVSQGACIRAQADYRKKNK
jgi:actin-like ATPase involved in cell morphogenesis